GNGSALRQPVDPRQAAEGWNGREVSCAQRRDDGDAGGEERKHAGDQGPGRGRRGRQRDRTAARDESADVGGRAAASGSGEGAACGRRGSVGEIGWRRSSTELYG